MDGEVDGVLHGERPDVVFCAIPRHLDLFLG